MLFRSGVAFAAAGDFVDGDGVAADLAVVAHAVFGVFGREGRPVAPLAEQPFSVPAETISAKRDSWIREWTATVIG